ncbi:MAG: histidinol dehydrogenase [Bacteroidetes bacterium]|nr:MAG: histidinol dehydrogenase [Bacteroidota bacterium]
MKTIENPIRSSWAELCKRPALDSEKLDAVVLEILNQVKLNGDRALHAYAKKFDNLELPNLKVSDAEFAAAEQAVSSELKAAIEVAKGNIERFHSSQKEIVNPIETTPGVVCWRESKAIEKVGLYIPGGSAPLFSTVLMLGIPAKLAACPEISLCTPPAKNGSIHPAILYTAKLLGIQNVYKVGGAQAIAAMAFGTESIPAVYKIFGPGNQFVTKAKERVQQMGIAIDMPAGPSEVLVIADETCDPAFVAADLLSQAEHGADSQVLLLSPSAEVLNQVNLELEKQLQALPRKELAAQALASSRAILLSTMDQCFELSNLYAPEHLIIASAQAEVYLHLVQNAGSVFVGNYSCESAGDYASGTNHTLPTNGFARSYSGVSLDSFVRKITFQKLSPEGLKRIGPAIEIMADAEELVAHKNAVSLRLKRLADV